MAYLQIYRNSKDSNYNYSVLKGQELYNVNLEKGTKMRWKYIGKIYKNKKI